MAGMGAGPTAFPQIIPPFYSEVFKAIGTVRNRLSDAHGRGPVGQHPVGKEHVEHLINFTAAHIVFLANAANI